MLLSEEGSHQIWSFIQRADIRPPPDPHIYSHPILRYRASTNSLVLTTYLATIDRKIIHEQFGIVEGLVKWDDYYSHYKPRRRKLLTVRRTRTGAWGSCREGKHIYIYIIYGYDAAKAMGKWFQPWANGILSGWLAWHPEFPFKMSERATCDDIKNAVQEERLRKARRRLYRRRCHLGWTSSASSVFDVKCKA